MKKVKNILFRLNLEGKGLVNFDGSEQKFMYKDEYKNLQKFRSSNNNNNYAKKDFYKDENGDLDYKLKISSNCVRHAIFEGDVKIQSPNIMYHDYLLHSFIASPASILRGYLFTNKKDTFKRKSPLMITSAVQTCNAVSSLETQARSGYKKQKDDEGKDNTFYKKESVGAIKYTSEGSLNLGELQFVSCEQVLDRYSFNPDYFKVYKEFLQTRLPSFDSELGYYQMANSIVELPEYGFKLSNEDTLELTKGLFRRMLGFRIDRNNAFAKTESLEYKLVYDSINDTYDEEDGWTTINSSGDIDSLDFEVEDFYILEDIDLVAEKRKIIEDQKAIIEGAAKKEKKLAKEKSNAKLKEVKSTK